MAELSVIIPTLDAADDLGPCLGALGEALFDGLIREVILADGGSTDRIAEVADQVGARLIEAPRGRGAQLAAGAETARGSWFLFLHADTVLGPGWADEMRAHITEHPGKAAYCRLVFRSDHRAAAWVAGWANLRARLLGMPFGDQGLLVSRTAYQAAGGYPSEPLMEDVVLARRLSRQVGLRALDIDAETSATRYETNGWLRQGAGNLWRQVRFLFGASPARLAARYQRK